MATLPWAPYAEHPPPDRTFGSVLQSDAGWAHTKQCQFNTTRAGKVGRIHTAALSRLFRHSPSSQSFGAERTGCLFPFHSFYSTAALNIFVLST